jgi:hypothetical protein
MNITVTTDSNYIMGSIPMQSNPNELSKWRDFLDEFLKYSLQGKKVYLVTVSPQRYSLGYELGTFQEYKIGKEKVLINFFDNATDNLISLIVGSEEFTRGLLKLVLSNDEKSLNDLAIDDYSNLKDELITIEDDGTSFYWYNPHLPNDQIEERIKQIELTKVN